LIHRSHIPFGAAFYIAAAALTGAPLSPLGIIIAAAASLLPDMDYPRSRLGNQVRLISVPISALFGYRTVTNSLIGLAALSLFVSSATAGLAEISLRLGGPDLHAAVWNHLGLPTLAGVASHLLPNGITPAGVPLLWPSTKRYALPLVGEVHNGRAGSVQAGLRENIVAVACVPAALLLWASARGLLSVLG